MGKIDELIAKYQSIEDNYESNLNLDYYERGVEAGKADLSWRVVEDLEQLKSSLPTTEITELQAWKKIAEMTDTDEPKFNPADFYHDMRILFNNAKFDVPVRGDKTLYDNGYRIVHKSSLPTQRDKVVVPPYVDDFLSVGNKAQKLACLVSCKYSILTCDMDESELKQWLREISMDDLFSIANGYTVEKEPLFIMPVPCMRDVLHYCLKDNGEISFRQGNAYKFTQDQIDKYFPEIKTMAVPVEGPAE